MITEVSRRYQAGARFGGNVTQPLPVRRVARMRAENVRLVMLLALFALLNACDLISTYAGLHSGMREGNPLMNGLLGHYGFAALIGYKLAVIGAVSGGVYVLRGFSKSIATVTIWVCNALVCAVVIMNVLQFMVR